MSDGITLLELPSDYKHNKRLDWFLMAATEAEKALKEGDILSASVMVRLRSTPLTV